MSEESNPPGSKQSGEWIGPIEWMARNTVAANLLMAILVIGGIWMSVRIQKEVFPDFQLDVVSVQVAYPGASPSDVEQGILLPVEEAVEGLEGIKEMTSTAREGSGSVELELIKGTNRQKVFQEIDQEVSRIRTFPEGAEEPEVRLRTRKRPVIEIGLYGPVDQWTLRKLGERVRDKFRDQPSITQVELNQVPEYVMHVEISQQRLRAHDISLGEVARVIGESSRDIPAGDVDTQNGEILLRMKERKEWDDEFRNISVISTSDGGNLTLDDLGTVKDGFEETAFYSAYNGQPSIGIQVFRVGNQTPLTLVDEVKNTLENLRSQFPPGLKFRIENNRARHYRERMNVLLENGAIGLFIVLIILSFFLEYRLAFWVMMGMAISFVGGMLFLPLFGVSVNMLSMFAFLLVLGIVVDDAIIVGENVFEYRQQGLNNLEAAYRGAKDIAGPVTYSIITNMVAFVPLMFIPGLMGKFFWTIPVVVIIVLGVSLFEALFILPAHLGHVSKDTYFRFGDWVHWWQESVEALLDQFIDGIYQPFLKACVRNRYITISIGLLILMSVSGYALSSYMGTTMLPSIPADEIEVNAELPEDEIKERAMEVADQLTRASRSVIEKHNLDDSVKGIKTNIWGTTVDAEMVLKPPAERQRSAKNITRLWREEIGQIVGVQSLTFQSEIGPGGPESDISVDLSHSNIDVLERASDRLKEELREFSATVNIEDNYQKGKRQLNFKLLPEGRRLGLTSGDVGRQIRNSFFGDVTLRQLRGVNEIEVRTKLPRSERESLHNVEGLIIQTPNGTDVPIGEVAKVDKSHAFTSINRRDGRRIVSVSTDVEPTSESTRVLTTIKKEVLPNLKAEFPGLTWTFEGEQADLQESVSALTGNFALAMLVIFALLAVAFRSYIQPLIVMFAIPFGIIGAVIGHILLGLNLSLMSMMGLIALSGVVVNDSLIMVDYANRLREEQTSFRSIIDAAMRRLRPILLTTLTTFGGLVPMIFETSVQASFLIPMAVSLGFGILFATTLLLIVVPCFYMVVEDVYSLTG